MARGLNASEEEEISRVHAEEPPWPLLHSCFDFVQSSEPREPRHIGGSAPRTDRGRPEETKEKQTQN